MEMSMAHSQLREKLGQPPGFIVLAELTGGSGYSFAPIVKFLSVYRDKGPNRAIRHSSILRPYPFTSSAGTIR
jgi:hypothetical protein